VPGLPAHHVTPADKAAQRRLVDDRPQLRRIVLHEHRLTLKPRWLASRSSNGFSPRSPT
jgi:hypothetical protein